tara:strand:- start:1774 stop:2442 length:669 start_codon:yes stop_codon:yes gene_type:complete
MQLSNETIEVLKNFANVNPNLVVSAGSNLKTISEAKNIMASADISETFDNGFGIYDLNEFLSALNLIDSPTLEFTDNAVKIKNNSSQVEYRFANIEILTQPAKSVTMPDVDLCLKLSADDISQIKRAAGALGHPVLSLSVIDNSVVAKVCDPNNPTANTWSKTIPTDRIDDFAAFDYQFLISNLKLLPGDYDVSISNKLISSWKSPIVEYWIALEKTSTIQE